MDGLSVLWWTCMKHCEWVLYICMCYRHLNNYNTYFYNRCTHAHIHTYILYTHTHCLSGTKHSLTRCNCQVRGPVIFCSLRTNWLMHTGKSTLKYIHMYFLTHTLIYLSSSSLQNGQKYVSCHHLGKYYVIPSNLQ